ncbi:unnamed protein product [Timema podura]|uniref:Uncharacterized protein n=1 Tax=Timema podura TaxID=61482 RepID=A0ABN7P0L9_TIMPD|nr:unnamed protein product [Timema podura]
MDENTKAQEFADEDSGGERSGKSLSEAAREYEEARAVKRKYDQVAVVTGEEGEHNVLQRCRKKTPPFVSKEVNLVGEWGDMTHPLSHADHFPPFCPLTVRVKLLERPRQRSWSIHIPHLVERKRTTSTTKRPQEKTCKRQEK